MTAATSKHTAASASQDMSAKPILSIEDLVLLRIAAAPATRAELQRDLAPLVAPKANGTVFRRSAELAIGAYAAQQLIAETRGRISATAAGSRVAEDLIAPFRIADGGWDGVRHSLLARALGLKSLSPAVAKAFSRPEGLAALVLQHHFALGVDKVLSPTSLRAELAVVALEKAFGNKIKTGLGKGSGLPGKAGRVLAGQLFKAPREMATDGKLVLALAADISGAPDSTADGLMLAVLRRLTATETAVQTAGAAPQTAEKQPARRRLGPTPAPTLAPTPTPAPDNDQAPLTDRHVSPGTESRTPVRPDMAEFSAAVVSAARPVSEGWPGNRKAFISLVWKAIRSTRPEWELSEVAFKSMLAEAHRSGNVVLAGADLKDKCDLRALEDSKILYKNMVWHFVRVED